MKKEIRKPGTGLVLTVGSESWFAVWNASEPVEKMTSLILLAPSEFDTMGGSIDSI